MPTESRAVNTILGSIFAATIIVQVIYIRSMLCEIAVVINIIIIIIFSISLINNFQLKRKNMFLLHYKKSGRRIAAVIITGIIINSGILAFEYMVWHNYSRNIIIHALNETEGDLIKVAENFEYSSVFFIDRYEKGMDAAPDNKHVTYPNYIDKKVIKYFWDRIGYLEKSRSRGSCNMEYEAKVSYLEGISVFINKDNKLRMLSTTDKFNEYNHFGRTAQLAYYNDSRYSLINASDFIDEDNYYRDYNIDFDINYFNCYMVVMELDYWVQTYSLAGAGFWMEQFVIIDTDYKPLFMYFERRDGVS